MKPGVRLCGLLLVVFAAAACGSSDDVPTAEELHGIWHNEDAGQNRVFEFRMQDNTRTELSGQTNVFLLYFYPVGSASALVQTGTYAVEERLLNVDGGQTTTDALVTRILWDESGGLTGSEFGNAIRGWDGDTLTITGSSGDRSYARVTAIP